MSNSSKWRAVWSAILALVIGTSGALALRSINAPVPFMLGAFLFTMVASLCRLPLVLPSWARLCAIPAIGVMLGSYFTPAFFGSAIQWWDGLLAVVAMITFSLLVGSRIYARLADCNPLTALLASTPGGAAEMTMLAEHYGADRRTVALSQTLRVATTAICLAMGLWATGYAGLSLPAASGAPIAAIDWGILVACAVLGCAIATRLKIPAGAMLGPVVLSALAHTIGLTHATPPALVVNIAQVIIGASLGVHFTHIHDLQAGRIVLASVTTALTLLAASAGIAFLVSSLGGRGFAPLMLGVAPGGLSEMAVITVAIGVEVAFVTMCHVARLFLIIGIAPLVARRRHEKRAA